MQEIEARALRLGDTLLLPFGKTATILDVKAGRTYVHLTTENGKTRALLTQPVQVKTRGPVRKLKTRKPPAKSLEGYRPERAAAAQAAAKAPDRVALRAVWPDTPSGETMTGLVQEWLDRLNDVLLEDEGQGNTDRLEATLQDLAGTMLSSLTQWGMDVHPSETVLNWLD